MRRAGGEPFGWLADMRRSVGNDVYSEFWETRVPEFTILDRSPARDFDDGRPEYVSFVEEPALTFDEIGALLGVSGNRIMQIERKALRKLRHPARAKLLREFIDSDPELLVCFQAPPVAKAASGRGSHCGVDLSVFGRGKLYCSRCGNTVDQWENEDKQ